MRMTDFVILILHNKTYFDIIKENGVKGMDWKYSKTSRTLDLYDRLCQGKTIIKREMAQYYGVDERSIQRDIDELRSFLENRKVENPGEKREILYDRSKKGFILSGFQSPIMTNSEILAVSKILLESRAFPKEEMAAILDKLVSGCVPQQNMKLVAELIANELHHYIEIQNPVGIQETIWDIGNDIKQCRLMEMEYMRQNDVVVQRVVQPVSILFSEYYFYLIAYMTEQNADGDYIRKYDYPTVYRVDRIQSYKLLDQKFHLPYSNRFEEGEYRKKIQFMYAGALQTIRFKYTGWNVDAILDRLPTAKIAEKGAHSYIIEAEVFGKGILMWLLSQGKYVQLLSPENLRAEMRAMLEEMLKRHTD